MHIPNWVRVYGSHDMLIKPNYYKSYQVKIIISKTHLKALDQPSEPCVEDTNNQNVSACIAKFIDKQIGCKSKILGSDSAKKVNCDNVTQLQSLSKYTYQFQEADANTIYKISGCLSSCEKDEYQIDKTYTSSTKSPHDTMINFRIMDSSYQEMEQYLLYDLDSFIADVGGFMGLLLGFSVLSIYNEVVDLLMNKLKPWQIFGKKKISHDPKTEAGC